VIKWLDSCWSKHVLRRGPPKEKRGSWPGNPWTVMKTVGLLLPCGGCVSRVLAMHGRRCLFLYCLDQIEKCTKEIIVAWMCRTHGNPKEALSEEDDKATYIKRKVTQLHLLRQTLLLQGFSKSWKVLRSSNWTWVPGRKLSFSHGRPERISRTLPE